MSLPTRPIKLSFRVRRNFARRDWTSIGLRGAHVNSSKVRTRTNREAPGSGLSHAHGERTRSIGLREPAPDPSLESSTLPDRDWRELLWLALIVLAIAAAASQVTT
jgi:hypothetical protein